MVNNDYDIYDMYGMLPARSTDSPILLGPGAGILSTTPPPLEW